MLRKPRILVREAVVILTPHVRGEQEVERREVAAPWHPARRLEPLRVLVEHRVDDVDERLVARDEPMPPGQQVPLEHALHEVLAERLDDAALTGQVLVERMQRLCPARGGHVEHGTQPVREHLVGAEEPQVHVGIARA